MTVLHLYPEVDSMIRQHVDMLRAYGAGTEADADGLPAIVHVHGCWDHNVVSQAERLRRQGARLVFTPHGGLEPWVVSQRRLTEKAAKTLLWQRRLVQHAYVVIAEGRVEAQNLAELGWTPRTETVRNAVVTKSVTPEAMAKQTVAIYRKVMDSHTLQLMGDDTRQLLRLALKAGITGDRRWVTATPPTIDETEWRRLLIYADQENVRTTLDSGLHILGINQPYIDTAHIVCYLPTGYERPRLSVLTPVDIAAHTVHGQLTLRHLVELDRGLRRPDVDDDQMGEALEARSLTRHFRRLLQLLSEQTLLDEGFMPLAPLDDKQTQALRNLLSNHLRI